MYQVAATVGGPKPLDVIERCYFAFRRQVRDISQASMCECNACVRIAGLGLKFVAHHGLVAFQRMAGMEELVGSDVVIVHRLLKKRVSEQLASSADVRYADALIRQGPRNRRPASAGCRSERFANGRSSVRFRVSARRPTRTADTGRLDLSGRPETKVGVSCHQLEVAVGREHHEIVPATELGEERVDSADLDAVLATDVPELGSFDMVRPVGHEEWERAEAVDDRVAGLGAAKALQQLLQHEPGRDDPLPRLKSITKSSDSRLAGGIISPQREGPHAGIDEEVHSARTLGLVFVLWIPLEGSEELDDTPLLVASDVLAQRARDRRGLGALTADLDGLLEQTRVDIEVGRHVQMVAQTDAQHQSLTRSGTSAVRVPLAQPRSAIY